jgi:5-formyltetrahydrofolate cyclo-ligase
MCASPLACQMGKPNLHQVTTPLNSRVQQAFDVTTPDEASSSESTLIASQKKAIRTKLRQQRRALTDKQQKQASSHLFRQLNQSRLLLRHTHIALYLGNDGELNPESFIPALWARKKKLYLPVIHPLKKHTLCFCALNKGTRLRENRFGIKEPDFTRCKRLSRQFLSLVMLPLVAFDNKGNRMGMGGGFYDRSFAYKHRKARSKPMMIGLAHSFQEQQRLPTEAWDVPLNGIVTDKQFYPFVMKP